MTATREATLMWVCVDCFYAHEGYGDESDSTPNREPLGLIPDDVQLTAGMLWEEHEADCPNRAAEEWTAECDCERVSFTWAACRGCGSGLGGERHALTMWA